jgi:hypothetical protein
MTIIALKCVVYDGRLVGHCTGYRDNAFAIYGKYDKITVERHRDGVTIMVDLGLCLVYRHLLDPTTLCRDCLTAEQRMDTEIGKL